MSIGRLFWQTKLFLWKEQLRVILRFYPKWLPEDLLLGLLYLFSNPFRICRKAGAVYGETPLVAWEKISRLAQMGPEDLFLDLGCGRGKLCLWTHRFIGCRTIGVDFAASFIRRANVLKTLLGLSKVHFFRSSLTQAPLQEASVVYLYTYHLEEQQIDFSSLRKGARVITVSEPLVGFDVLATSTVQFPWGEADVYVNRLRDH